MIVKQHSKWLTLLVVLALTLTLALPAFAAEANDEEWTMVGTKEELEAALADEAVSRIRFTGDINTGASSYHITRTLELDPHGYTWYADERAASTDYLLNVSADVFIHTGNIEVGTGANLAIWQNAGNMTLTSVTLLGRVALTSGAVATIEDCHITVLSETPENMKGDDSGIYINGGTLASLVGSTITGGCNGINMYAGGGTIGEIDNCTITGLNHDAIHSTGRIDSITNSTLNYPANHCGINLPPHQITGVYCHSSVGLISGNIIPGNSPICNYGTIEFLGENEMTGTIRCYAGTIHTTAAGTETEDGFTADAGWRIVNLKEQATGAIGQVEGYEGREVVVPVTLSAPQSISSLMLTISYNSSVLELKSAVIGSVFTKVANAETTTRAEDGKVVLNWVTTDSWFYGDGEFALLTFLVRDGSAGQTASITATYNPENVFNGHFINIDLTMEDGSVSVADYLPGDISDDGEINAKDAVTLLRYVTGYDEAVVEDALDTNGDGAVNNKDAVWLLRYIAGYDITLY